MSRKSPFSKLSMRIMGEKSSSLDLARGRIVLIVALFMIFYVLVAARLVDATVIQGYFTQHDEITSLDKKQDAKAANLQRRADIVDRNGVLLATSLKTASLYADPKNILDPVATAKGLVKIFPDLTYGDTLKKLQDHKRFVWIRRNLTPDEQKKILEIGEPGLAFEYDYRRFYPQGPLASHLVGYSDVDGRGLAGVERSFNNILTTTSEPLQLTIDVRLQHILRREIQRAMTDFSGIAGSGIVMDVKSGEILAAISLPDFEPQNPSTKKDDPRMFNRITLGVFEMGSIFKIFTTAALLDKTQVAMATKYNTLNPIVRDGRKISDFHPEKHPLTVPEIFMHSSNVGTVLMAESVGTEELKNFLKNLGLTKKPEVELDEVGAPIVPRPWRNLNTLTASYGHGIAVSPLQMITAATAIVNGGTLVKPTLIKSVQDKDQPVTQVRVIRQETSLKMRQLLRLVVTDGTGGNAEVPGYMVGGKTGTAQKIVNGRYALDKRVSSFVAFFPINDPQYAIFVSVDEPKPNKHSYGYATAGWVSAPAVSRIVSSMAPILNINPFKDMPELAEPLRQYVLVKAEDH